MGAAVRAEIRKHKGGMLEFGYSNVVAIEHAGVLYDSDNDSEDDGDE